MGQLIDFAKFKQERKATSANYMKREAAKISGGYHCPFCSAPTTVTSTAGGTDIHTYTGIDLAEYNRMKGALAKAIFAVMLAGQEPELRASFGEGFDDFLKEIRDGS